MGIDPATHKPKTTSAAHPDTPPSLATWLNGKRLGSAEARLVRECKLLTKLQLLHKTAVSPLLLQPVGPPCLDVLKVWQATASRNGGFFGSAGSLESPTSTLNFAGDSLRVPKVGPRGCSDDAVSGVGKVDSCMEVKGKMDNSAGQLIHDNNIAYPMDYNYNYNLQSSMENEGYNNSISPYYVGDFEDNKNYWNELFNLVSSPLGSPVF
ncbi:hypothetical protein DH2020_032568 [Rehmannia glutinosa]|uniref:Uncharacterized protein n=1 Tax=Rehmannia glutinosa TaxID=99300 RepID=A0ABR0VEP6_REHGL